MTRKLLDVALMATLGATMLFGQSSMKGSKNAAAEHKIQKLETSLWQAWKDHDTKAFEEHLSSDSIDVVASPVRGKANILKGLAAQNCKVSSFSLSDFAYQWLDAKSVIVIYTGTQDAVCNGQKIPGKINASSVWVKRSGRWLSAFHQESPAM